MQAYECDGCGSNWVVQDDGNIPTECFACGSVEFYPCELASDSLEAVLESGECYTLSDAPPLGAHTAVGYLGKFWREFDGPEQWAECISAIALNMEREQYWPEVIYVNDHGNVMSVDIGAAMEDAGLEWPSVCEKCKEPVDYCHGHGELG